MSRVPPRRNTLSFGKVPESAVTAAKKEKMSRCCVSLPTTPIHEPPPVPPLLFTHTGNSSLSLKNRTLKFDGALSRKNGAIQMHGQFLPPLSSSTRHLYGIPKKPSDKHMACWGLPSKTLGNHNMRRSGDLCFTIESRLLRGSLFLPLILTQSLLLPKVRCSPPCLSETVSQKLYDLCAAPSTKYARFHYMAAASTSTENPRVFSKCRRSLACGSKTSRIWCDDRGSRSRSYRHI